MKTLFALSIALLAAGTQDRWVPDLEWLKYQRPLNRPLGGFVTKKDTAIAIGRAIIDETLGEKVRKGEEPLAAKRFGDVWVVYGNKKVYDLGGTVTVQLSASTGTVINVTSEQ